MAKFFIFRCPLPRGLEAEAEEVVEVLLSPHDRNLLTFPCCLLLCWAHLGALVPQQQWVRMALACMHNNEKNEFAFELIANKVRILHFFFHLLLMML